MPAVEQDLTQGSVTRKLVRYALPLVASSLLQAIYSITDIIIAGHYIGDVGISAINNASIIMNMLTQLAIGLTVGGNVLVGQYFGSGDHENRRKAAGNMLTVGLIAGLLFAVGILLLGRPLLILLQSPTLEEATAYLSICGVGLLFIFVYNSLSAILRGVGNSRIPLYCIIASVSLNVVLDILFVAGFHMGVAGAALATVIGQAISCLTALVFSLRHRADLGLLPRYLRPEAEMVKRTLKLGFPVALRRDHTEIAFYIFFRSMAFFLRDHCHRSSFKKRKPSDHGRIIPETAVSVKLCETIKKKRQKVRTSGAFRRTGQRDMVPGFHAFFRFSACKDGFQLFVKLCDLFF